MVFDKRSSRHPFKVKSRVRIPYTIPKQFRVSNLGEGGGLLIREAWFESRTRSQTIYALLSLVAKVLPCKQGSVVRFHQGAPILSRVRLAAIPPGLGPGFRKFESFTRDQNSPIMDLTNSPF
jgi:hypothetical protein